MSKVLCIGGKFYERRPTTYRNLLARREEVYLDLRHALNLCTVARRWWLHHLKADSKTDPAGYKANDQIFRNNRNEARRAYRKVSGFHIALKLLAEQGVESLSHNQLKLLNIQ